MRSIFSLAKISVAVVSGVVLFGGSAMAADASTACVQKNLSVATLAKGFTVKCKGAAQVGVPAGAASEPIRVTITQDAQTDILKNLPANVHALTAALSVQANSLAADAHAVLFSAPLAIAVQVSTAKLHTKELYQYDAVAAQWQKLSSGMDWSKGVLKTSIQVFPATIVAVELNDKIEGIASWYGDKLHDSAASNDFPMGTKLRVRNPDTKKSVEVVVRSKGPFVAGRVIDLSARAFSKIQAKWKGVAKVVVEKL